MVLGRPFPMQISNLAWVCETGVWCGVSQKHINIKYRAQNITYLKISIVQTWVLDWNYCFCRRFERQFLFQIRLKVLNAAFYKHRFHHELSQRPQCFDEILSKKKHQPICRFRFRFPLKIFHSSDDVIRFCWWCHWNWRFWRIFRSSENTEERCDLSFCRMKLVNLSF